MVGGNMGGTRMAGTGVGPRAQRSRVWTRAQVKIQSQQWPRGPAAPWARCLKLYAMPSVGTLVRRRQGRPGQLVQHRQGSYKRVTGRSHNVDEQISALASML